MRAYSYRLTALIRRAKKNTAAKRWEVLKFGDVPPITERGFAGDVSTSRYDQVVVDRWRALKAQKYICDNCLGNSYKRAVHMACKVLPTMAWLSVSGNNSTKYSKKWKGLRRIEPSIPVNALVTI